MDHRHGRFRCAPRRVTRAAVVETGGGGDGERGRWRRGISSSSAPTVVETPATNPVFRIEDYELEGRSARNLKARPAMHRTGCPGRRERTLRVPGGRSRSRNEGGLRAPADAGGVPEVAVRSAGGVRPGVRGGDDPASPREGRGGSGAADRARQGRRDPGDLLVEATGVADSGVSHTIRWQFLAAETEKQTVEASPRYGCCGVRRCACSIPPRPGSPAATVPRARSGGFRSRRRPLVELDDEKLPRRRHRSTGHRVGRSSPGRPRSLGPAVP